MSQIFSPSYAQPSLPGNEPLVLVYDTTLGSKAIMVPFGSSHDIAIDWDDGIVEYFNSLVKNSSAPNLEYFQFYQHTYEVDGVYTVKVYGNAGIIGPVSTIATVRSVANIRQELVRCLSFGNLGGNFGSIFYNCPNLVEVPAQLPSTVTSLGSAFRNCTSFNQDIGGWDTSNITSMSSAFHTTSFNQDISGWDTSNVVLFGGNSAGMFQNNTAFNQPIGTWNTSKAESMRSMFQGCTSFNQDIGGWDMSQTGGSSVDLQNMFNGATSFNQDLKSWCMGAQLTQPSGFSTGSGLTAGNLPVWGTCPNRVTDKIITFIGSAAGTRSATLPSHQAGDLILAFAATSGGDPTIPIGWEVQTTNSNINLAFAVVSKIATSSSETTGFWPNSRGVVFAIYRNAYEWPRRSTVYLVTSNGTSTSITYPTNNTWPSLAQTITFSCFLATNQTNTIVPSGITSRIDASPDLRLFIGDSNGLTTGFTSQALSVGGSSNQWRTVTYRILPSL